MTLLESEHYYLIDKVFPASITAGFTKPSVKNSLPEALPYISEACQKDVSFGYMKQVHSGAMRRINKPGVYECDALSTEEKKICLIVKTADCMPLIFSSKDAKTIGVIHMGWRSAKDGILNNIKQNLSQFTVVAGVGLRKCCYKVGEEFLSCNTLGGFTRKENETIYFDPVSFAKNTLINAGLKEEDFFDSGICSFCSTLDFFSWRRDNTESRTLSFIVKQR